MGMKTRGYSLAELMVGLSMMAVVIAMAVPAVREQSARSRERELAGKLQTVRRAVQQVYADTNGLPVSLAALTEPTSPSQMIYVTTGQAATLAPGHWRGPYLTFEPIDPVSGVPFTYSVDLVTGIATIRSSASGSDRSGTLFSNY